MRYRFRSVCVLAVLLAGRAAPAADPAYEMAVASGTLLKVEMGTRVTFAPDEMGKAGKQVTLDVTAETAFLEVSAATGASGKLSLISKAIKQVDLQPAQKQLVSVIYARVGDENRLLVLAAASLKLPKSVTVDGVRGILNKIDAEKSLTVQPFVDNKFGKQSDVAVLTGSKFFEMAPRHDVKRPFTYKGAKLADLSAKRQAIAILVARIDGEPSLVALVAQPAKDK